MRRLYFILLCCLAFPLLPEVASGVYAQEDGVNPLWGNIEYKGKPWVSNFSSQFTITRGLADRHITVWASHGRYYNNDKGKWEWQRPHLFGTTEDLFTQTIVLPFLIPMLENAGAVVFTPRERSWQTAEYIVDPDGGLNAGPSAYSEYAEGDSWTSTGVPGFAAHNGSYYDNENPFKAGYARKIKATKKDGKAFAMWKPYFSQKGQYAVYVSYQTDDKSVEDAHYTVFHQGMATEFRVNQKMGGGTWVYLGTFTFDRGSSVDNCVMLTNQSKNKKGVVTADAVRFGGGMGNIQRGGSTSGYPRALEGARYYAQWAGAPYNVYGGRNGTNDYADDINTRSLMSNWLSGGSVYNPVQEGLGVPVELSLAVHSDAGYAKDGKSLWGSLAICTTDFNDGRLASGITRQSSKQFASALLNNVVRDLAPKYKGWPKRYLWDRNYSETRLPAIPSAILETMSHQNFPDMVLGQDPDFRFDLARSIYKTIARYVNGMHGETTVIEPLAPQNVAVELRKNHATLSWIAQKDPQESSAAPEAYIVYTAIGKGGFDNGKRVKGTSLTLDIEPQMPYHFKVTAINKGGESFPSEVVSAYYEPGARQTVLVVNGFHRLSAPAVVNDGARQGFDLDSDIGVSYGPTMGWNGRQTNYDITRMGIEGSNGLGYGGDELAGRVIAGNSFNYISEHTEAIATAHKYNVASCSSKAVETGRVVLDKYDAVDLILGLEKYNSYSAKYYKAFTPSLKQRISEYMQNGGRMMVSGAYVASDMTDSGDRAWLSKTFNVSGLGQITASSLTAISGMGLSGFAIYNNLNPEHYAVQKVDALQAIGSAFCAMQYSDGSAAAIGCDGGSNRSFIMGFPFETITDTKTRGNIMRGILSFLLK